MSEDKKYSITNWLKKWSKWIIFICLIIWVLLSTLYTINIIQEYNILVDEYKELKELSDNCYSLISQSNIMAANLKFSDGVSVYET